MTKSCLLSCKLIFHKFKFTFFDAINLPCHDRFFINIPQEKEESRRRGVWIPFMISLIFLALLFSFGILFISHQIKFFPMRIFPWYIVWTIQALTVKKIFITQKRHGLNSKEKQSRERNPSTDWVGGNEVHLILMAKNQVINNYIYISYHHYSVVNFFDPEVN